MTEGTAPPGSGTQDPQVISNPPGRAQISYRVDDFTGFRRAMLRPLPGEQAIGAWRPAPGDLGLQILEWWAYLADVLTFYNERIANENYLRTATRPASIANLVALLGYEPAPGIAAIGSVAAIRSAARPNEPLIIPAGLQLSSAATPGVPAQTFEADAAASFTGPSTVPLTLPPDTSLAVNPDGTPQSVLLAGRPGGIKAGDQLLLAEQGFTGSDDNWSLVTVGALTPVTDPGTGAVNTLVTFATGGWGPTPAPPPLPDIMIGGLPLRFRDEFTAGGPVGAESLVKESLFAATRMVPGIIRDEFIFEGFHWVPRMSPPPGPGSSPQSTGYRLMRPTAAAALWTSPSPAGADQQVIEPNDSGPPLTVRLSAAIRGISPGDVVLFDGGAGSPSALAVVAGAAEELWVVSYPSAQSPAPNPPLIAVMHTALALTLAGTGIRALLNVTDPAAVAVRYGFKDVGTIIGVPAPNLPSLPAGVGVPSSYTAPSLPAAAFLQDATGGGVLVTVTAAGPGQVTLTGAGNPPTAITTPLPVPLQLLLDVVPVSRGKTVTGEVLGSGNATLAGQSFTLSKSPLTYLASGSGAVPALAVYVDGIEWQRVPSFYGQAANARVFVVSRSPDQTVTTVTFGDGLNGAKLPSGTGNVAATYRYGSGAASPPAGRLTTISQPQPNLAAIQNPVAVSGGTDPQASQDVRVNAPASVFTFGRAVSATDYEVIAAQAPGVSRVAAHWTFDGAGQRTLVTIYVGGDPGAAAAARAALAGSEDPNRPVTVVSATAIELTLNCTLVVAADRQIPAVVAAAAAAVSGTAEGLFSPAHLGIGQRLYRSAIDAALMVPGVVAVHGLTVIRALPLFGGRFPGSLLLELALGEFFDPDEGAFFDLPPGNVTIVGVSASG